MHEQDDVLNLDNLNVYDLLNQFLHLNYAQVDIFFFHNHVVYLHDILYHVVNFEVLFHYVHVMHKDFFHVLLNPNFNNIH